MLTIYFILVSFVSATNAERIRGATLKPISACCDIPELGDAKPLAECSNPRLPGPCDDVKCVFEKSGFLSDQNTLNKEVYREHLLAWSKKHEGWSKAIDKVIEDCVDKELRQYLAYPCRAYDVFTCTGIAMLKKCPDTAWKC